MANKVKWIKDPQLEAFLKERGVKFTIKSVSLKDTLVNEGLKNNARLEKPLDDDTVTDYGMAMEQGKPFPMPAVHHRRNGYFPLSGNHRVAAADLVGDRTYDAYQIDTDDALVLDDIIRVANRWHGRRQSREEALRHAHSQMTQFSLTAGQAAEKFGIPEKSLQRFIRADKIAVKLQLLGVTQAARFASGPLLKLGQLEHSDTVLRESAKVSLKYDLGAGEIDKLVEEVKDAPNEESKKLAAIGRFASKIDAKRRAGGDERKQRPLKTRFTSSLRALLKLLRKTNPTTWGQVQVTGAADQAELKEEADELIAYLKQLMGGPRVSAERRKRAS